MNNRTIAAIATPLGPGGIGIIRISGPQALSVLKKLFVSRNLRKNRNNHKERSFLSHHVYYGQIHEMDSDNVIDEVLVFYMEGPNSYTREDVVEIQSHSGYVVLDRILSSVLDAGADLARPGEFTQKAFLNGRIDLTQAEAVIDLINAPCEIAANIAAKQISGTIKEKTDRLLSLVNAFHGQCEAIIEFEESDALPISERLFEITQGIYQSLWPQITRLIESQKTSAVFCEGVLMAIAGSPNVGKSSLLNQLVDKEIAIVSEFPGTTRDVIREYISINGIPVTLCDTAGLHETQDPVECIGIDRAHDHIDRAELLLFTVEATRRLNSFEKKLLADNSSKRIIIIINKTDIADSGALAEINSKLSGFSYIEVSAKTGLGMSELKKLIFNTLVRTRDVKYLPEATPNLRQRKIFEEIERIILKEKERKPSAPELVAENLVRIRTLLEEISGANVNSDVYDYIFSQFCIGK